MYACNYCDIEHQDWSAFNNHLRNSACQRKCKRCRRGFGSYSSYAEHLRQAESHVKKRANLQYEPTCGVVQHTLYLGVPSDLVKPVFDMALRLRRANPTVEDVLRATETLLSHEIVSSILEGALRLLPVGDSPEAELSRKQKARAKAVHSAAAETAFIARLQVRWPALLNESEQQMQIRASIDRGQDCIRATPDVLFPAMVEIAGMKCRWIEYKNFFGFKRNPFVHQRNLAQYKRYLKLFGPGFVVYKLGYEQQLMNVDGVQCVREADILTWVDELP